jgi:hypothetical protein
MLVEFTSILLLECKTNFDSTRSPINLSLDDNKSNQFSDIVLPADTQTLMLA